MSPRIVLSAVLFWAVATCSILAVAQESSAPADKTPAKATETAEAPEAALARIAICEDVQERKPVGESDSFSSDIGRLWCFTKVVNAEYPITIFHRWYVGDSMVQEIPISVKGSSWRCWSNKGIQERWSGSCRVEILTESGDVLGTKEFNLSSTPGSSESSDS